MQRDMHRPLCHDYLQSFRHRRPLPPSVARQPCTPVQVGSADPCPTYLSALNLCGRADHHMQPK
jgi:hypothetical protein